MTYRWFHSVAHVFAVWPIGSLSSLFASQLASSLASLLISQSISLSTGLFCLFCLFCFVSSCLVSDPLFPSSALNPAVPPLRVG